MLCTVQETNEQSFKLLQNYIDSASRDIRDGNVHQSYTFEFYVIQEKSNPPVQITLPPPNSSAPEATRRSLNKLFKALNIDEIEEEVLRQNTWHDMPLSLREFIPLVHESYLLDCADVSSPTVELRNLKTALQFSRRIRVIFSDDLNGSLRSILSKITMVQSLIAIMPSCPESLRGLSVGFGTASTIDEYSGTVWLNANVESDEWLRFICNVDLQRCHNSLERKAAMYKLSDQVASSLGVGLVYGDDSQVTLSDEYECMLLSTLEHSPTPVHKYPDVSIRFVITPPLDETVASCKDGTITLSLEPVTSQRLLLHDVLNSSLLREAAEQARKIRSHQSQMNDLKKFVEKKLRLRLLAHDPGIPDFKFKTACQKLLEHATEVRAFFFKSMNLIDWSVLFCVFIHAAAFTPP